MSEMSELKLEDVQLALDRAHRVLWKTQKPDGSWDSAGEVGPWVTAQVVTVLRYLDALDDDDTRGAVRWLAGEQRGDQGRDGARRGLLDKLKARAAIRLYRTFQNHDGSWNGSTILSTLVLPALVAAGVRTADPMLAQALAWLDRQKVRDATGIGSGRAATTDRR